MNDAATRSGTSVASPWEAVLGLLLKRLEVGELLVTRPGDRRHRFVGRDDGPVAEITVSDPAAARRIALAGDIGLAESYLDGLWDTPDLQAVLALGLENTSRGWPGRMPFVLKPVHRRVHRRNDNDPESGARRNIAYHYDLGNDFYRLWLDETMTYSAACWEGGTDDVLDPLAAAQTRKYDRILELLQPTRGDHILEIGCGWGGFGIHAARESGCRVTGLTLSQEQADFARERIHEAGLEGLVDVRLEDYRSWAGPIDGIASIEMFEAVGQRWWPTFFNKLKGLLPKGGAAALQVITIEDKRFDHYVRHPDFTQLYVFPGGMLPSPERFCAEASTAGLRVSETRMFGPDYARTLDEWARRFEEALPAVRALGFDDRFVRLWRYYLAYCKTGFAYGSTDVMQVRLEG